MAKDLIFAAGFVASGVGATGLTVTVDIRRVTIADLTNSEIVTAGSATELGDGLYAYRYASADLQTYLYYAIFKTSGTADVKHLFGVWTDYADGSNYATATALNTVDDLLDTEIAAIKAKTDNLPASPANEATLTTIAGYIDTEVAAIKAKTDLIPASPSTLTAAQVDTQLSASHGAGTWGAGGNGGALSLTYTLTSSVDSSAIQGATVELYAEVGMVTLIDSQVTNALGQCTFSNLVAGTYYLKRIKSGWTFGNPDSETVS